jgi:hypothetical protein
MIFINTLFATNYVVRRSPSEANARSQITLFLTRWLMAKGVEFHPSFSREVLSRVSFSPSIYHH